jgi:sugar/nucleoside kinase (ribokinase family)
VSLSSAPIAIVGNLNLDIRTSPIAQSEGIFSDGETGVEAIYESLGGGGANTAIAAALMGGDVHFCCAVGRDELGRRLCEFLERHRVHVRPALKPAATGRSIALTWITHQRHFLSSLPHARLLEETDIDLDQLSGAGCRHLYRADAWFADRMLAAGNASLFRRAREAGMETSLDVNWDPLWTGAGGSSGASGGGTNRGSDTNAVQTRISQLRSTLSHVSFVHGNERELSFFAGTRSAREAARRLLDWGAGAVIVHRGPQGCAAATPSGWLEVPAVPVAKIVSETGTGDVFTAAFLLTADLPLAARLHECAAAAARHMQGSPTYAPLLEDPVSG